LGETLWPDEDWDAVRSRIRRTLSSLRRDLSANGDSVHTVCGERDSIWLNPESVIVDVEQFAGALLQANRASGPESVSRLESASACSGTSWERCRPRKRAGSTRKCAMGGARLRYRPQ